MVGDVLRVRRAPAETAIERAGFDAPGRVARGMYSRLARGLCELLSLALHPRRRASSQVDLGHAFRQIEPGRGAVIATAHTGNWDLAACAVAEQRRLTVITKRLRIRWLDRLWQGLRRRHGVQIATVGKALDLGGAALRRGEWVAALIDQAPERARGVVRVPFLGEDADVDLAPALLALRARVPLVIAFARRLDEGRHTVDVEAVIEPPAHARRAWAEEAMIEATEALERFVRAHPAQWLWMHRRWKKVDGAVLRTRSRGIRSGAWPKAIRSRSAS